MPRLFVAIHVEPTPRLRNLLRKVSELGRPVRAVGPEQVHVTLGFLGAVAPDRAGAVEQAVLAAAAGAERFELPLRGLGGFPSSRRPKVVWAGVAEPGPVQAVHGALWSALAAAGHEPERRPYAPHATLARVGSGRKPVRFPRPGEPPGPLSHLLAMLQEHAGTDLGAVSVNELTLYESQLSPQGAVHTPRMVAALQ